MFIDHFIIGFRLKEVIKIGVRRHTKRKREGDVLQWWCGCGDTRAKTQAKTTQVTPNTPI